MVRWQVRTLNVRRIYQFEATTHQTKPTRYEICVRCGACSIAMRARYDNNAAADDDKCDANWVCVARLQACSIHWNTTASHTLEVIFSPLQQFIIQISVQTVGRINFVSSFLRVRIDDRGCGVFLSFSFVFINFTQLSFFFNFITNSKGKKT